MFEPTAASPGQEADSSGKGEASRANKTKCRGDYDIIKKEFVSFYADTIRGRRNSVALILSLFILYGLMYFIVTSAYCLNIKSNGGSVKDFWGYFHSVCVYVLFYPVMIMHSWKFIDKNSERLIDQLFSYKSIFIIVTISYVVFLFIASHLLASDEMPLGLIMPVIASALVPSFLHIFVDSL